MEEGMTKCIISGLAIKGSSDGVYSGYVSTSDKDDQGDVVLPTAFENLDEFVKSGGPIFYAHGWTRGGIGEESLPVGRVIGSWIEDDRVGLRWVFVDGGPMTFAPKIKWMVDNGFLNKMSVGFLRIEDKIDGKGGRVVTKAKILEGSIVGVPANDHATIIKSMSDAGLNVNDNELYLLGLQQTNTDPSPDGLVDGTPAGDLAVYKLESLIKSYSRSK
jgi:HK97 family phage prohead protease